MPASSNHWPARYPGFHLFRGVELICPIGFAAFLVFFFAWISTPTHAQNQAPGLPPASEADRLVLIEDKIPTDPAGLALWLVARSPGDKEMARLDQLIAQLGDEDFARREQATKDLTAYGNRALAALRIAVKNKDPEVKSRAQEALDQIEIGTSSLVQAAALRHFGRITRDRQNGAEDTVRPDEILMAFFRTGESPILIEAARDALAMLSTNWTAPTPAVLEALKSRSPALQGEILRSLLQNRQQFAIPLAKARLSQTDPEIRARAAFALAYTGTDLSAMGPLLDHMEVLDEATFALAEDLGYRLGEPGTPAPFPMTTAAERKIRADAWRKWWSESKDKRLSLRPPLTPGGPAGSTMVVMLDAGRIVDLDINKKARFDIKELQFPLDAQLLSGPRVLVAEHGANKVSERDAQGNILWAKGIEEPLVCQRLASGNTFIANIEGFVEVDHSGAEVVKFRPKNDERLMKAQRRADGFTALILQSALGEDSRLVWLDPTLRERASFPVQVRTSGGRIETLPGDEVLLPELEINRIARYDSTGKVTWKAELEQPVAAVRTPAGTILANCKTLRGAVELNEDGKEIWSFQTDTRVTRAWRR